MAESVCGRALDDISAAGSPDTGEAVNAETAETSSQKAANAFVERVFELLEAKQAK